ncbi:hypothetical protein JNW90_10780 [Micromonospora sp. STR1s_5]|nr:hypothetical protein [Micromonospora sp. STR1s_5]
MTAPRRIEYVPLTEIERAPRNPKRHDTDGIRASIDHWGLVETPTVDERTGRLVAGHGRLEDLAARRDAEQAPPDGVQVREDGEWLVPVLRGWSSRSDADAEAYLVASNQLSIKSGWDQQGLAVLMTDLHELDAELAALTGIDEGELDDLLRANKVTDLDDFAGELKDPSESDGWPVVKIKVPHHLSAAWESHLDTHGGDEPAAFAKLLRLDATPPPAPEWDPINPAWANSSPAAAPDAEDPAP